MKQTVLVVLCALSWVCTQAQVKQWTLQECVEYAVENNLTIEQYELDLENAQIDHSDAVGALVPNFNLSTSPSFNTGLVIDPTTNELVSETIFSIPGNVSSSVVLFDGLRNYKRLNRAKLNELANQYRVDDLKDDIRLSVANAYLEVISNKETLSSLNSQLAVTQQDLDRTKELVDAGGLPKGDLLEIEATFAGQQQQIVNAENMVLISKINLAQLMQITDYANFDVADVSYEVPPSDILAKAPRTIYEEALTFRKDIKYSESLVEIANKDLEISKGAYYPTLGAFMNYNTRFSDQNLDPITGETVPFRDQLWLNDGISYGAQLSIPVFNGFNVRNSVQRSMIGVKQAELQLEQEKLNLEATVNQAYADAISFAKAYEAAEKSLEARSMAYEYAKERYEVGLMNAFDFGQSQARVDDAKAAAIRAKYDYIFRLKVLEFYFGIPVSLN